MSWNLFYLMIWDRTLLLYLFIYPKHWVHYHFPLVCNAGLYHTLNYHTYLSKIPDFPYFQNEKFRTSLWYIWLIHFVLYHACCFVTILILALYFVLISSWMHHTIAFFLFKIVLVILKHLLLHMNFKITLLSSKKFLWGFWLRFYLTCRLIWVIKIFTILSIPIHKYSLLST